MYVILSRFGDKSPWTVKQQPVADEAAAIAECEKLAKYDLTRTQYRYASIGDEAEWPDPLAEDLTHECMGCGMSAPEGTPIIHKDWCPHKTGVL